MAETVVAIRKAESKEEFRGKLSEHERALIAELYAEHQGDYEAIARRLEQR